MVRLQRHFLVGLQGRDFDFACKQMSVTRSVVDMVSGKVKTEASQKTVPWMTS
jgi:hypothetical protein